jgi:hypothetical protein
MVFTTLIMVYPYDGSCYGKSTYEELIGDLATGNKKWALNMRSQAP